MEKVKANSFYVAWIETVTNRKDHLVSIWRNRKEFTNEIRSWDGSVIFEVARKLDLLCYPKDYYSIDAILYKQDDLTPKIKTNNYWFRDIRVAFEHENQFNGGLFQEASHLLIINCDLRVLVSYPNNDNEEEAGLKYLHEIITGNRQSKSISDDESFLIIFGYENGFEWNGYIYKQDGWNPI